ncbi:MAG: esterase/lipase family protein [Micromonosporaceae bacterium]
MTGYHVWRRLLAAAALTAMVAVTAPAVTALAATTADRDPVVFVHGYQGNSSSFYEMIADFKRDGYTDSQLYAWDYFSSQSNKTIAQQFAKYVDGVLAKTGASKVDIVGWSMGGINTRWYLKALGGTAKVDDYASLGTPHHGTNWAYGCPDIPCFEMRPDSAFMKELNAGDETPGAVHYGSWWSPCDELVIPHESPVLAGATNTKTGCISHFAFGTDDTVSAQVRAFVR